MCVFYAEPRISRVAISPGRARAISHILVHSLKAISVEWGCGNAFFYPSCSLSVSVLGKFSKACYYNNILLSNLVLLCKSACCAPLTKYEEQSGRVNVESTLLRPPPPPARPPRASSRMRASERACITAGPSIHRARSAAECDC